MLTAADFDFVAAFLKQRSGLELGQNKLYLLESRLLPLAQKHGLKDISGLTAELRRSPSGVLVREVVEAMTTNESSFFRDTKPFELFRNQVLPNLLATRAARKSFRIWCAAASTGQEPYSLAMLLKDEAAKLAGWQWEIIGTDLSSAVLARAQQGTYNHFEVQRGLPAPMLVKYFRKKDQQWEIIPELRAMVKFREHNLLNEPSSLGKFDVVFCRNVLIYFDRPTKAKVLDAISRTMAPDGVLFLGGAETVLGITETFKPTLGQGGLYSRADAPQAPKLAAVGA